MANNLIHDAPHSAILYGGNEHVLELNEIHHVAANGLTANTANTDHLYITRNEVHHTAGVGECLYLGNSPWSVRQSLKLPNRLDILLSQSAIWRYLQSSRIFPADVERAEAYQIRPGSAHDE